MNKPHIAKGRKSYLCASFKNMVASESNGMHGKLGRGATPEKAYQDWKAKNCK